MKHNDSEWTWKVIAYLLAVICMVVAMDKVITGAWL